MTIKIKLIENKQAYAFFVTVNDKEAYTPFTYTDFNTKEEMRKLAKACAFDEALREQMNNKIQLEYIAF